MLHLLKFHWKRRSALEIVEHQHTILLPIHTFRFSQRDSVVSGDQVRLVASHLILKLAKHDVLLVFEFFFGAVDGLAVGYDGALDLEFDILDHLFARGVVDGESDHGLRILTRAWLEKLALNLGIAFAEDAERTLDITLGLDTDRGHIRRVKLSQIQILLILNDRKDLTRAFESSMTLP